MPWIHHLNPYALGPFEVGGIKGVGVRWYGLAYLTGFGLIYLALKRASESGRVHNLDRQTLENLVFGVVLGVLVGGRMGFVVQHLDQWRTDPMFPLKLNQGGMAFFGGLAGVSGCFAYFRWRRSLNLWELGDVAAPIAALSLGIGRIANFVNGELWGKPTGSDWGVIYPMRPDQPRHPSELYECASHLLLAGLLFALARTPWGRKLGNVGGMFLIGYVLMRCVTEIWRDQDYYVGAFSAGQIASFLTAVIGVGFLLVPKKAWNQEQSPTDQEREDLETKSSQ